MTDLTKSGIPNKVQWNYEHERAFQSLKSMLLVSPIGLRNLSKSFIVRTDASDYGEGAVLMQEHEGKRFPVAYASKKLSVQEKAYFVIEKECLAFVWVLERFQLYLYGGCRVVRKVRRHSTYSSESVQ